MTKKDYIRLAYALHEAKQRVWENQGEAQETKELAIDALDIAARNIAKQLSADNPQFNPGKFLFCYRIRSDAWRHTA
jgi:hypothetical protein